MDSGTLEDENTIVFSELLPSKRYCCDSCAEKELVPSEKVTVEVGLRVKPMSPVLDRLPDTEVFWP
jgi:hypothetical protein